MTTVMSFAATLGTLFAGFIIGLFAKEKYWKEKVDKLSSKCRSLKKENAQLQAFSWRLEKQNTELRGKLNVIRSTAFLPD